MLVEAFVKDEGTKKNLLALTGNLYIYPLHVVHTGDRSDLASICSDVVAGFDSRTLEAGRRIRRVFRDASQKK
jgi:hypothetical protein